MHKIFFVIGASGSGKTAAIKEVERMNLPDLRFFYFDSIGVPSFDDMVKEFGSGDEWQRAKTKEWVARLKKESANNSVVLDAQTRPSFIDEACRELSIKDYEIILLDCSDEVRRKRLGNRRQPELADERMMSWARYLKDACQNGVCEIIDNTDQTRTETVSSLANYLRR